ncbi:MAG: PHP domain-containing protein [Methylococcaceae bacterium]|nr:PHP domain-containing protein [Methylococcaceae bacterium]MDZ4157424.1 PHP domain-containing protein [Methylococcales bacterium]MDP2393661.1 PHP domain-containing protein [Methylococcaceae bacterium]MDP3020703.1 PHP domain-containing protein [Methylococcaceae bacterium]MDP3390450.1 PHP domain-containing protein [Methylococcaceae bacterium]
MSETYDLHCHSTASDGALSPTELVQRASQHGVTHLSLTDHDTTQGLAEAHATADACGIQLINGIELSTSWQNHCFHIVGLGIDPSNRTLTDGIKNLQLIRTERAEQIAAKLAKNRIPGALTAVKEIAGTGMITRTHFADFLLSQRHVSTQQEAFDRYLGSGKTAYVSSTWAELRDAVSWITEADGVAVLAHPLRYKLTASRLRRLLTSFKDAGGQSMEVVTGRTNPDEIRRTSLFASQFQLAGSVGSDFHNPANVWVELGRLAPLPKQIQPVWELLK